MRYYQGDDINFSIDIKQVSRGVTDWSYFKKVVLYFYTNESYIVKYTNEERDGYEMISLNEDSTRYTGLLKPEHTHKMRGALKISIRVVDQTDRVLTKDIRTGIRILETPIKYE